MKWRKNSCLSSRSINICVTHFFQETTWNMLSQLTSFTIVKFVYILFKITRTLANSNLALTRTKIDFPWISVIHRLDFRRLPGLVFSRTAAGNRATSYIHCNFTLVTRTLDNLNSRLLEPMFVSPQVIFYIILPSITRTMFWALKKSGKKPSTGVRNTEFWISY